MAGAEDCVDQCAWRCAVSDTTEICAWPVAFATEARRSIYACKDASLLLLSIAAVPLNWWKCSSLLGAWCLTWQAELGETSLFEFWVRTWVRLEKQKPRCQEEWNAIWWEQAHQHLAGWTAPREAEWLVFIIFLFSEIVLLCNRHISERLIYYYIIM